MRPGTSLVRRPPVPVTVARVATAPSATRTDRVAIVTGGSRGLGREIALDLARRGYAVVVNYASDQRAADEAVEEILATEGSALTVRGDVSDELDVQRLFSETSEAFGGVDVVVHAAGQPVPCRLADCDVAAFDALLRTNVLGTFIVNRQAAQDVRHGGAIVNLPALAADGATAGAVETITRVLSRQLRGRDITVNAVAIGPTRPDTSAGIVGAVAFLVSAEGHWLNGQVVWPDDGMA
jgi:3-oxoacyl-[acyl-carrier protein] reductase